MKIRYCDKWDCYHNEKNNWTEKGMCSDKDCEYCKDKPKKHLSYCDCWGWEDTDEKELVVARLNAMPPTMKVSIG